MSTTLGGTMQSPNTRDEYMHAYKDGQREGWHHYQDHFPLRRNGQSLVPPEAARRISPQTAPIS
jgi:hypothetical protein